MNPAQDNIFLEVKDYSVSGEMFELRHNAEMDMLYTFPKPEGDKLAAYYESQEYISHTDGNRSLFEKTYQWVKKVSIDRKLKLISKIYPKKGKLLDIGAGTGDFLSAAKVRGWNSMGIEPSAKAKEIAIKKGVVFTNSTEELADKSFDVITMWHVLEHVPDTNKQFLELKRLIKSDGAVLIAVPNFKSYDALVYQQFWAAYDVPRHLWHFSKSSIQKLASKHGLTLDKVLPMPFDAFYVSLLSEKYKTGSMNPIAAVFNGLKSNVKAKKSGEFSSHIYVLRPNTNKA